MSAGPPFALNAPDFRWHGLIEYDEVGRRYIQSLFTNGCCDKDFERSFPEFGKGRKLLLLRESFFRITACLPDETMTFNSCVIEVLYNQIYRVAKCGKDNYSAVRKFC